MSLSEFRDSLEGDQAPKRFDPLLESMWHDAKGDWERSHNIAQEINTTDGSWVHAYLHRKEGDASNAAYWYRLAGKKMPLSSLDKEWDEIVSYFLVKNS